MSGYARIHRSLLGHPAFRNDAESMAFAWLVIRAAWKPARVRYKGRAISLGRGQLAVSVRDFADAMDRDKAWVERLLTRLRRETMISSSDETGVNVITICNYSEYQAERDSGETQGETPHETDARQTRDTEQEDKELKKEEDTSGAKAPSVSRAPRFLFACPLGVDPAHWRDFLANRKKRRLTNSETAYRGILDDLEKFTDAEWPPGRLVELAARRGWGSIVNPREHFGNRHDRPSATHPQEPANPMLRAVLASSSRH